MSHASRARSPQRRRDAPSPAEEAAAAAAEAAARGRSPQRVRDSIGSISGTAEGARHAGGPRDPPVYAALAAVATTTPPTTTRTVVLPTSTSAAAAAAAGVPAAVLSPTTEQIQALAAALSATGLQTAESPSLPLPTAGVATDSKSSAAAVSASVQQLHYTPPALTAFDRALAAGTARCLDAARAASASAEEAIAQTMMTTMGWPALVTVVVGEYAAPCISLSSSSIVALDIGSSVVKTRIAKRADDELTSAICAAGDDAKRPDVGPDARAADGGRPYGRLCVARWNPPVYGEYQHTRIEVGMGGKDTYTGSQAWSFRRSWIQWCPVERGRCRRYSAGQLAAGRRVVEEHQRPAGGMKYMVPKRDIRPEEADDPALDVHWKDYGRLLADGVGGADDDEAAGRPLVAAYPAHAPVDERSRVVQLVMEQGVAEAGLALPPQPLLSLYAAGRMNGPILESGDGVSVSAVAHAGRLLRATVHSTALAGALVTERFRCLLADYQGAAGFAQATGVPAAFKDLMEVRYAKDRVVACAVDGATGAAARPPARGGRSTEAKAADGKAADGMDEYEAAGRAFIESAAAAAKGGSFSLDRSRFGTALRLDPLRGPWICPETDGDQRAEAGGGWASVDTVGADVEGSVPAFVYPLWVATAAAEVLWAPSRVQPPLCPLPDRNPSKDQPSLWSVRDVALPAEGLHWLVARAVEAAVPLLSGGSSGAAGALTSASAVRQRLYGSVHVAGGNTAIRGFDARLTTELRGLLSSSSAASNFAGADPSAAAVVQVTGPPVHWRAATTIHGAAVLSAMEGFGACLISRKDYDEEGPLRMATKHEAVWMA